MSSFNEYIKILNLSENFTQAELKKAYKKAALKNHPDRFPNPEEKAIANEKMKKINQAYEYLQKYKPSSTHNKSQGTGKTSQNSYNSSSTRKSNTSQKKKTTSRKQTSSVDDLKIILEHAIKTKSRVEIKYKSRNGRETTRIVVPLEIVEGLYEQDQTYLKAYCEKAKEERTFRFDRILNAKRLKEENSQSQYSYSNQRTYNSSQQRTYNYSSEQNTQTQNDYSRTEEKQTTKTTNLVEDNNELGLWGNIVAGALFIALFDLPYWYYQILRWVVFLYFICLVINVKSKEENSIAKIVGGIVVLLYNPIFPFRLEKEIWVFLNIITIGILPFVYFYTKDKKN